MAHHREDWADEDRIVRPGPRRGGMKSKPTTPKPDVAPPGQKPLGECDNFGCGGRTKDAMCCPECLESMRAEVKGLRQWVQDLQSGMYVNCVYCGHRYGPKDEVPTSMAEALKEHIMNCPEHPMSELARENEDLQQRLILMEEERDYWERKYRMD